MGKIIITVPANGQDTVPAHYSGREDLLDYLEGRCDARPED